MIEPAGQRFIREGTRRSSGAAIHIGNIIGSMSGGNVQGVGSAESSDISQVVEDSGELSAALDEFSEKLLAEVQAELQERDLQNYARALDDLKVELQGRKDAGRVKRALRTLALRGDVEGSIGLMVRLWPIVGAAGALAHGLGIS